MNIFKKNEIEYFDSKFVLFNNLIKIIDTTNNRFGLTFDILTPMIVGAGLTTWALRSLLNKIPALGFVVVLVGFFLAAIYSHIKTSQIAHKIKHLMTSSSQQLFQDIFLQIKTPLQEELLDHLISLHTRKQYGADFIGTFNHIRTLFKEYDNDTEMKNKIIKIKSSFINFNTPQKITPQEKYKELM